MDIGEVEYRDLAPGDAEWLTERHVTLYGEQEGFDETLGPVVAGILEELERNFDPTREKAWIAWKDGMLLGSIFCVQGPEPGLAKLRLFIVVPEARGLGLGQALLDRCLAFARQKGYAEMTLWTHESHKAACAMYAKAGFRCVASKPVHSFGVDLVEQEWRLDLSV